MTQSRKNLKVFFAFILFLIAIPSESTSYHDMHIDRERPFSAGTQGTFVTRYLMYVYVTMPATYNVSISWEYWGSNSQANISVLVMDGPNFASFRWHFPYNYESASNGSATLHTNGIWNHNSTESQYDLVVVYWNNGTNHESTLLTTNTTFTFSPSGLTYYGVTQFYHGTGTEQASLKKLGGSYYNGIYIDDFYMCALYPNDWIYEYYSMSKNDKISWHFSAGTLDLKNTNVTISVIAMDAANYALMVDGSSYSYYPLAERNDSYSKLANGTFSPPNNGTWYILFAHYDPIGQPVNLMFDIKINRPNTPDIPDVLLIVIIIIFSCVGVLVAVFIHRLKRRRNNPSPTLENLEKTSRIDSELLSTEQNKMMAMLDKIEHQLRDLINTIMSCAYGDCWYNTNLKQEEVVEMQSRWKARNEENPTHRIIDEFTFNHFKQIMTGRKGVGAKRKGLFVETFGNDYEFILGSIGTVAEIRNRADHRNWHLIDWKRDLALLEALHATLSKISEKIK